MKLNIANPSTGCQKMIEIDDEKKLRMFMDKRMSAEVPGDSLGDEFKGYIFKITGGNDKEGFPMKQGVLVNHRVRLLLKKGHSCFRERRPGERIRKSVRGCITGADLSVMHLVVVKKGEGELPGLTDVVRPRRLGPKRASKIRKLFNLTKTDDVRKFVIRRTLPAKGDKKPRTKAPKIQRLVTPITLQRKRRRVALKKRSAEKHKQEAADYAKLLALRTKEKRSLLVSKKRGISKPSTISRLSMKEAKIEGAKLLAKQAAKNKSKELAAKASAAAKGKGKEVAAKAPAAGKGKEVAAKAPAAGKGKGKGKEVAAKAPAAGKGKGKEVAVKAPAAGKGKGKEVAAKAPAAGKDKGKEVAAKAPAAGKGKGKEVAAKAPAAGKGKGKTETKPAAGKGKGKTETKPAAGKGKGKAETKPAAGKGKGKTEAKPAAGKGKTEAKPTAGKGKGKADTKPAAGKGKGKADAKPAAAAAATKPTGKSAGKAPAAAAAAKPTGKSAGKSQKK